MAFTKINAAGIGTTETVTVDGLTVINDGSFGGNLTVSGVLTYEDVTNVDSVGLITARNGIVVGSGITLSKDGDIFATGITTVNNQVHIPDYIHHVGDTNCKFGFESGDTFAVETAGVERARIDSSGRLLLGTTSVGNASAYYDNLIISNTTSGEGSGITLFAASNGYNAIDFADTAAIGRGRITYYHADDTLRIDSSGAEAVRVNSDRNLVMGTSTAAVSTGRALMIDSSDGARIKLCDSDLGVTASDGFELIASNNGTAYAWNRENTSLLIGTNNTERLRITADGTVLHGTGAVTAQVASNGGVDVSCNNKSLVIGADSNSGNVTQARTNNTDKDGRLGHVHYTNAEEPVGLFRCSSTSSANTVFIGGGSSLFNTATTLQFYTAANTTTTTGTERMRIFANGNIHMGSQAIGNEALTVERVNAGGDVAIRIHNDTSTDADSTASLKFTVSPTNDFDAQLLRYYRESNNFAIQYSTNNPTILLTNDQKLRVGGAAHTVDPICGTGGIDIQSMGSAGAFPFVVGADNTSGAVTRSSNTEKQARMGFPTYSSGSGTVCTFAYLKAASNANTINIGGGTGWGYASSYVNFYGAADAVTTTGTLMSQMEYQSRFTQYWNLIDGSMWNNSDAVDGMAFQGTGRGSMQIVCNRSNGYANIYLNKTNVSGGGSDVRFIACYWNGNAEGNLQYNTSSGNVELAQESDYRLKKNVADMVNGIDKVKQLRPVTYQWNDLSTKPKDVTLDGFIAHEVAEVIPQAVMGAKDATKTDEDGNENVIAAQELEQKNLIPTLTAALKEAIAKIEVLEAKVAALEG